jgi:tetratricopeptide (TPR) repeat protein
MEKNESTPFPNGSYFVIRRPITMNIQHAPNWIGASTMLREAMEQYQNQHHYSSLPQVVDDLITYIEHHSGKWLSEMTIKRDAGNRDDSKRFNRIPDWRVKIYAKWLYEKVHKDRDWLAEWLEQTAYPAPGTLLSELDGNGDGHKVSQIVKTNVPPLRTRLWGRFLGRREEMERLRQWADQQRHPIAVLYGFGGNGKTTIQQKVGEDFVHGVNCSLRWPYDGAVWISAVDYPGGQPCLIDVLREIAKVFGMYDCYGDWDAQTGPELYQPFMMRNDVKDLLEKKRVLVLLDNFETVSQSNQAEILRFFNELRGTSQTLASTRYRPDWYLEEEHGEIYSMAHILIQVDGLSAEDAETLVQDFLRAKSLPQNEFEPEEIKRLIAMTQNNPKTILALLGLVEQGMALSHLLNAMTSGGSEADRIYDAVIDRAWKEILVEPDKAVLMAKAFFRHSVSDEDLGQVAGVDGNLLRDATKKLAAISFFEFERTQEHALRISTHPLAQDFARRVLHDHSEFEKDAEDRWWRNYGPRVVQNAGQTPYESLRPEVENDVANVVEHLNTHIQQRSSYCQQAATLFSERGGLGHLLFSWGRYNEVLRVAKPILEYSIEQQDPKLIGECALDLIGTIYIKRQIFDEADRYMGLVAELNTTLHDRWLGAVLEYFRAFLYRKRGYVRAAQQAYQNALDIFLELESLFDIAEMYRVLGGIMLDLAVDKLEGAIDTSNQIRAELAAVEKYFHEAETYLNRETPDWEIQHRIVALRANKAIIARLRGDLNQARDLFQSCIGQLHSLYSVADLYSELALVEHLADNKELAYAYEEKSVNLFQQLGITETLPPEQCFRAVNR